MLAHAALPPGVLGLACISSLALLDIHRVKACRALVTVPGLIKSFPSSLDTFNTSLYAGGDVSVDPWLSNWVLSDSLEPDCCTVSADLSGFLAGSVSSDMFLGSTVSSLLLPPSTLVWRFIIDILFHECSSSAQALISCWTPIATLIECVRTSLEAACSKKSRLISSPEASMSITCRWASITSLR